MQAVLLPVVSIPEVQRLLEVRLLRHRSLKRLVSVGMNTQSRRIQAVRLVAEQRLVVLQELGVVLERRQLCRRRDKVSRGSA